MNEYRIYLPIVTSQVPSLKNLFARYGIRFGFCVGSNSFDNPITRQLIVRHANIVTTESELNMKFIQLKQGIFDWSKVDKIVSCSHKLGIDVHGIPGSWAYPLNPDWLVNGSWTNEQLANILQTHVSTLAAHLSLIHI